VPPVTRTVEFSQSVLGSASIIYWSHKIGALKPSRIACLLVVSSKDVSQNTPICEMGLRLHLLFVAEQAVVIVS
jgi:hypothetical protein